MLHDVHFAAQTVRGQSRCYMMYILLLRGVLLSTLLMAIILTTYIFSILHNNTAQACYAVEAIPDSFQNLPQTARWLCGFDLIGEKRTLMGYQRAATRLHSVQQVTH